MPPTSGMVLFNGEPIHRLGLYRVVNRGIARTFQLARPFAA